MKIRAAILRTLNAPLELEYITSFPLKKGQVLVEICYSGLCHSQLNEIKGLKGEDKFLPHTLGHEGSGIVLEVGEGVTKVKEGDHVVLSWIKGSGLEAGGATYQGKEGVINSGPISTFLSHAVISENRLVPIPKEMPLKEAALLGCAIATGGGVIKHEMNLKEGDSLALFGAGGVGLSALIAAKTQKSYPLIAIDVSDEKLERARKMGASHTLNALKEDVFKKILHLTQEKGVDFAFESAGKKEAMEEAFRCLRPGGLCVLAGNLPVGERISIDPFDLIRGKRLIGTWGGKSQIDSDTAAYCTLFLNGELSLDGLITHEVELPEINALIGAFNKGEVGRGIIAFKN